MRSKHILAMALTAAVACTALTACGNKTAESSAADAAGTTAGETSKAAEKAQNSNEKKVLSVTTWDNDTSPQFQAVIDAYMEKNPNVEIKVVDTSADEYNNSLGISLSAAQPDPDIIWVKDMGSMLQMADKKQLLPLDDFMKKDNLDTSVYNGAAEQLQYNGATYGLPYRSDWYVLYY